MITSSKPGRGWEYERNPQWAKTNAKLLPQLPSGHVDKIKIEVLRNPQTEVNDVESGKLDWMQNEVPPDRYQSVLSKFEGSQFRVEPTVSTYFFWMNTTQAPFDNVKVRQAVQYAIDPAAMERIYSGRSKAAQQILPPGMPGYKKLDLYPHDVKKAKELIAEANPSDREITVWTNNETADQRRRHLLRRACSKKSASRCELKVLSPDNYFAVIGNSSTPELDTGWANWFEDYPHPNDFFQPLLAEESIAPTNGTNLARFADPTLSKKIVELGEEPLGPRAGSGLRAAGQGIHGTGAAGPVRDEHRLDLRLQRHQPRKRDLQRRPSARTWPASNSSRAADGDGPLRTRSCPEPAAVRARLTAILRRRCVTST